MNLPLKAYWDLLSDHIRPPRIPVYNPRSKTFMESEEVQCLAVLVHVIDWNHWFAIGDRVLKLPGVFHVNWFRRDAQGRFLWPGYGENLRVLAWIIARSTGQADAVDTPIGAVPTRASLDLTGLALDDATIAELLAVDHAAWRQEAVEIGRYFATFGTRVPERLRHQFDLLNARLA